MSTYREMLRDPRWQKKRLEIMQRDGFACRRCNDTTKTLNVHHLQYRDHGHPPWDYPDHLLITFCEKCHNAEEAFKKHFDETIAVIFRQAGATNSDMHAICTLVNEITTESKLTPLAGLALIRDALEKLWSDNK